MSPCGPSPRTLAPPVEAAAALARIERLLDAVDPLDAAQITVDIPTAAAFVLGALPAFESVRPALVRDLPGFRVELLDHLETYAQAAYYAHLATLPPPTAAERCELAAEAAALRAALLADAEALAKRGLVSAQAVAHVRAGHGPLDTANDLVTLAALFSSSWAVIAGEAASKPADVRRAALLGPRLLSALGLIEPQLSSEQAEERRLRAFTWMARAYARARCAVACVRWNEGDADLLAPPLSKAARWPADRVAPSSAGGEHLLWAAVWDRARADLMLGALIVHRG